MESIVTENGTTLPALKFSIKNQILKLASVSFRERGGFVVVHIRPRHTRTAPVVGRSGETCPHPWALCWTWPDLMAVA